MNALPVLASRDGLVWEARGAWAGGRRIAVSLDPRSTDGLDRLEGLVRRVAATGAFLELAGRHVPVEAILALHYPSRLGDSNVRAGISFHGAPRRHVPQHEELFQ